MSSCHPYWRTRLNPWFCRIGVLGSAEWTVLLYTLSCCVCVHVHLCSQPLQKTGRGWRVGNGYHLYLMGLFRELNEKRFVNCQADAYKVRCSVSINSVALSDRCGNGRIWVVSWLIQGQWQVSTEQTKKTLELGLTVLSTTPSSLKTAKPNTSCLLLLGTH